MAEKMCTSLRARAMGENVADAILLRKVLNLRMYWTSVLRGLPLGVSTDRIAERLGQTSRSQRSGSLSDRARFAIACG
jgi:hypothetical protein